MKKLSRVAVCAAIVLFLAAAEILLNRFLPEKSYPDNPYFKSDVSMSDPYLLWKVPEGQEFRGRRHEVEKVQGVCRIICLGDSVTQGFLEKGKFLSAEQTYPYLLEQGLNIEGERTFEVMNAGIAGYSSLQAYRYFIRDLLKYQPDVVIIALGMNDARRAIGGADKERAARRGLDAGVFSACYKSRLFRETFRLVGKARFSGVYSGKPDGSPRVSLEDFRRNIGALVRDARQARALPVLLVFENDPYADVLRVLAAQKDILIIDAVELFARNDVGNHHLTAAGHRELAEILTKRLLDYLTNIVKKY